MQSALTTTHEIAHQCHAGSASVGVASGEQRYTLRGLSPIETSDDPPTRFKIANWKLEKFRGGSVLVNNESVTEVRRRMSANRVDRVRIDVCHKTAFKKAEDIQPEDILGYGDLEDVPGDGLYVCNAQWGARAIRDQIWKLLPDPSPAFYARKGDHMMTQLDSVGLCPNGELELPRLCSADNNSATPPDTYLKSVTPEAMLKTLLALLTKAGVKVPAQGDMPDTEYEAVLTGAAADYVGSGGGAAEEKAEMTSAKETEYDKRLKAIEDQNARNAKAADTAAKREIMSKCSAEGKVVPLTDEQIFGKAGEEGIALSALEAIYGNLKATVAVKAGGDGKQADKTNVETQHKLSADEQKVADIMGVTAEELEKFAPAAGA